MSLMSRVSGTLAVAHLPQIPAVLVTGSLAAAQISGTLAAAQVGTIPVSQIHTGMRGVAYTVFQGIKPESMDVEVLGVLKNVNGLAFCKFDDTDVVRHHLVQRIVRAYDEHKTRVDAQLSLTLEPQDIGEEPLDPAVAN